MRDDELTVNGHTVDEVWLLMLDENIATYENVFGKSSAYWMRKGDRALHIELEGREDNVRIAPTFDFLMWSKKRVRDAMLMVKSEMEGKNAPSGEDE